MEGQRIKFGNILSLAVGGLDDLDRFISTVREWGKRHLQSGVPDAHYAIVGAALLNTLEDIFLDEWNENLRQSWLAFYTLTALTIKSSASQAA